MRKIWLLPIIVILVGLACSLLSAEPTATLAAATPTETLEPTSNPYSHLILSMEPANPKVGELVVITADVVELGLPYYYLMVQDEGAADPAELGRATYNNEIAGQEAASQVVHFVQAEGDMHQATFTLLVIAPGTTSIWVNATGEVQASNGAWTWGGGGSEPIVLTVTDR